MQFSPHYQQRIDALRRTKLAQTQEKQALIGSMDHDDWALILPPPDRRKIVQAMSGSGVLITDCLLEGFEIVPNHPNGGFYGPLACGSNFRRLMEAHPVYIDPESSLAGGYMVNFMSYRKHGWKPEFNFEQLVPDIQKYRLAPGIGAAQHFCQDLQIGLDLGWGGLLEKIRHYRVENAPHGSDFYQGLEDVVLGMQNWISRTAQAAIEIADMVNNPANQQNLREIAEINARLVNEAPRTFREACQWILWFQIMARMYNGSGSLGRLDVLLTPYYEREQAAGMLSDEEAVFDIACLLLRDTAYIQLGGPDAEGNDVTNRVSYLVLEAAHALKIPANIGVCVGDTTDPGLLRRGVEIMFADKTGVPKFLGIDRTTEGFARNGIPLAVARNRSYSGCHWSALPGREYTVNDCVKVNFAKVFEVAWNDLFTTSFLSVTDLWVRFEQHLRRAVDTIRLALDFHMAHMHEVLPELPMDLLCHGTLEKGEDASHGGVEYVNLCIDGAALGTVADSFAALATRLDSEKRMSWTALKAVLDADWAGEDGERARRMMHSTPRYGVGGTMADEYALRIAKLFTDIVKEKPTPGGFNLIPGLFSWASTISMGKDVGATPNGRKAGEPITHGSNPEPGFRKDGAPTAMAAAIAAVQPGWGNAAPMQMELDPLIEYEAQAIELVESLIRSHFQMGGTQINLNIMDRQKVLAAHEDPSRYPGLVVRVTGFSAYFASLSPAFRQLVVDRIMVG